MEYTTKMKIEDAAGSVVVTAFIILMMMIEWQA